MPTDVPELFTFRDVILGRSKPSGGTTADIYVVPNGGTSHILGMMVCNASAGGDTFRISISPAGAATAPEDYLYFDLAITGNNTFSVELDISLRAVDTVRVRSGNGTCVFTLFGVTS